MNTNEPNLTPNNETPQNSESLNTLNKSRCGFDVYHTEMLNNDPEYSKMWSTMDSSLVDLNSIPKTLDPNQIITIPVVFHIVYNTASQNISDSKILAQISQLNLDYSATNPDNVNTPLLFQPTGNMNIQFCLAKRDPNGNPTTGIERRQTTVTQFTNTQIRSYANGGMDPWDANNYLNIWVGNLGVLGAGLAGSSPTRGVELDFTTIGSVLSPGLAGTTYGYGRTATHEIGHFLGLDHPWGNYNCSLNDYVLDTPPADSPNYGCPTYPHLSTCPGSPVEMTMNFMDYVNDGCMYMFSPGQVSRARGYFQPGGFNESLLYSPACVEIGVTLTPTQTQTQTKTPTPTKTPSLTPNWPCTANVSLAAPYYVGQNVVSNGVTFTCSNLLGCGVNASWTPICGLIPFNISGVRLGISGQSFTYNLNSNSGLTSITFWIVGFNPNQTITFNVNSGTISILPCDGCCYNFSGNILTGQNCPQDTFSSKRGASAKFRITSTSPFNTVLISGSNPTPIGTNSGATILSIIDFVTSSPLSTQTPTITPTVTPTVTPTSTLTPTNTITKTQSPTNTPTQTSTQTQTPTNTITKTITQTTTPTNTQTLTNTITQTITKTITPTNTVTPTPTDTPLPPFISFFQNCCDGTIYKISDIPGFVTITIGNYYHIISDVFTGCTLAVSSSTGSIIGFYSGSTNYADCNTCFTSQSIVCPSQTPTVTPTNTITPTITQTQTITKTVSNTQTLTNTQTITQTPTNTITSTPTQTTTPTKTITPTQTITPTVTKTPTQTFYPPQNAFFIPCCSNLGTIRVFEVPLIVFSGFVNNNVYYIQSSGFVGCATFSTSLSLSDNSFTFINTDLFTLTDNCSVCNNSISVVCPTLTPTQTPTNTVTPTITKTITTTPTVTNTNTQTITNTQTQTNTPLPPTVSFFQSCCDNTIYKIGDIPGFVTVTIGNYYYIVTDIFTGCTIAVSVNPTSILGNYINSNNYISCNDCFSSESFICPTPTPTNTITNTITVSQTTTTTNTLTPTLTTTPTPVTPTVTPTNTKTPTITNTPTNTYTQTQTVTSTITPTITQTPTNNIQIIPKVDFVCVHWYKGPNSNQFINDMTDIINLYGKPIWVTEFAPQTVSSSQAEPNKYTQQEVNDFINTVIPWMEQNPMVERYAWHDSKVGTSAVFTIDGQLTETGITYRDA